MYYTFFIPMNNIEPHFYLCLSVFYSLPQLIIIILKIICKNLNHIWKLTL